MYALQIFKNCSAPYQLYQTKVFIFLRNPGKSSSDRIYQNYAYNTFMHERGGG